MRFSDIASRPHWTVGINDVFCRHRNQFGNALWEVQQFPIKRVKRLLTTHRPRGPEAEGQFCTFEEREDIVFYQREQNLSCSLFVRTKDVNGMAFVDIFPI